MTGPSSARSNDRRASSGIINLKRDEVTSFAPALASATSCCNGSICMTSFSPLSRYFGRSAGAFGAGLPDEPEAASHLQASARRARSFEKLPRLNDASDGVS